MKSTTWLIIVSKEGVGPTKENLKSEAKFAPPQTYTEIQAFLAWWDITNEFIKGFVHIMQPLHKHLSGEGTSKKNEHVTLTEDMLDVFEILKKVCLKVPVFSFADFNKWFLLETDASKKDWELCYHRNRLMVDIIW